MTGWFWNSSEAARPWRHQFLAAKATIRSEPDVNVRPLFTEPCDNEGDLVLGACRGVDIGGPEFGQQKLAAAENVQRQIAVACVVAVKEAAFLARRGCVRLNEEADEQLLHGVLIHADLAVAVVIRAWRMFQPVQRRFAGKHGATGAAGFEFAREEPKSRIVAQFVMIVQVFIAERNAVHALGYEPIKAVLDQLLVAPVRETGRRLPGQSDPAIGLPQQQRACVRGDGAAIERGCYFTASKGFKFKLPSATQCRPAAAPNQVKCLLQSYFP